MNQIRTVSESDPRDSQFTDLTDGEAKTIASFVIANELRNPQSKYLEIGVWAGSTIRFCKSVTKTTTFTGVDLFEDFQNDKANTHESGTFTRDNVAQIIGDRATLIKGNSHDVLPKMTEKFDHIFIDGNHTYEATMKDFNDAIKLLAPGGQISFHNASTYMWPDFELYIKVDGGPWLVTQHILAKGEWKMTAEVDRLRVFEKVKA